MCFSNTARYTLSSLPLNSNTDTTSTAFSLSLFQSFNTPAPKICFPTRSLHAFLCSRFLATAALHSELHGTGHHGDPLSLPVSGAWRQNSCLSTFVLFASSVSFGPGGLQASTGCYHRWKFYHCQSFSKSTKFNSNENLAHFLTSHWSWSFASANAETFPPRVACRLSSSGFWHLQIWRLWLSLERRAQLTSVQFSRSKFWPTTSELPEVDLFGCASIFSKSKSMARHSSLVLT